MNDLAVIDQTPILRRKAIARNPEKMSALLPVERALFLASIDKPVSEYSAVELAKELRNALQWIAKDVGFRSSGEKDVQYLVVRTAEILKRYYRELSLKDFRMAFEMCLTGELDAYLPKNREGQPERSHYQNFNAEYICRILNAYRARRSEVFRKIQPSPAKESAAEMTSEQKKRLEDKAKRNLLQCYECFLATGNLDASSIQSLVFYNILSESGLAEDIVVTDAERKEILNAALADLMKSGASYGEITRKKQAGIHSPDIEPKAFSLARRNALRRTFEEMKTNKINLKDYVRIED